eukprot:TRINITY_DN38768_c0_g1_i1.p1 TRINITY_DN38768_c0_g1~~TRINITY_DN38768_c0_g1_i1.p1  ORF type:complete len:102 (-),score=3.49 TRINITY_DN38768_c0_g1_i1:82-387(-)
MTFSLKIYLYLFISFSPSSSSFLPPLVFKFIFFSQNRLHNRVRKWSRLARVTITIPLLICKNLRNRCVCEVYGLICPALQKISIFSHKFLGQLERCCIGST